jgi:diaminohydroxyphosphoribosylaminopyrimidine deaminase/5-amino-6-(5-phosphoribosylamino)uracil reductase
VLRAQPIGKDMMERADSQMMDEAIAAAGNHRPHPNPRVGAVVVDSSGTIVGRGGHAGPGTPHAETLALTEAGGRAGGATLYVTLEPCVHHGRTPPCTDAIITAGITRVVVGVEDPDKQVAGRGIDGLRQAGIATTVGVAADAARALDPGYFHHRTTGRPRVTLKAGLTLDGQVAAADGTSRWITSPEARADAHRLRSVNDAVLVGAGTVLADDPALTVRLDGFKAHQPLTVVVAGRRRLPVNSRVFARPVLVYAPTDHEDLESVEVMPTGGGGQVDLERMLDSLGGHGVVDLLVEGGPTIAAAFWHGGLVDRGVFYLAGALAGGAGRSVFNHRFASVGDLSRVEIIDVVQVGPDLRVEFEGVE